MHQLQNHGTGENTPPLQSATATGESKGGKYRDWQEWMSVPYQGLHSYPYIIFLNLDGPSRQNNDRVS